MKKQIIYFLGAILLIVSVIIIIRSNGYPIASINGRMITAEYYSIALESGRAFYGKDPELAERLSTEPGFQAEFENDLKRATLDAIIKYEISRDELIAIIGEAVALEEVSKKVEEVEAGKTENTDIAVSELFGIDWSTYKLIVIEPEAYKAILKEEIDSRGLDFNIWFNEKLKKAEVEIFLSGFKWSGTNVEPN